MSIYLDLSYLFQFEIINIILKRFTFKFGSVLSTLYKLVEIISKLSQIFDTLRQTIYFFK